MMRFCYHSQIFQRFPELRAGVVLVEVQGGNGPSPPELADRYRREQETCRARIEGGSLAEIESLAAWRRVFHAFGVKPTQHRTAVEALLRRLVKKGEIPCLNALVDLGNLVSIRHAVPVGVFDTRAVRGTLTVRFATGEERFTELGSQEVVSPLPGEVIFVDDAGVVGARRWCWRQSAQSAARADTAEALITVEAHHSGAEGDVTAALEDLQSLVARFCGTVVGADLLTPEHSGTVLP